MDMTWLTHCVVWSIYQINSTYTTLHLGINHWHQQGTFIDMAYNEYKMLDAAILNHKNASTHLYPSPCQCACLAVSVYRYTNKHLIAMCKSYPTQPVLLKYSYISLLLDPGNICACDIRNFAVHTLTPLRYSNTANAFNYLWLNNIYAKQTGFSDMGYFIIEWHPTLDICELAWSYKMTRIAMLVYIWY